MKNRQFIVLLIVMVIWFILLYTKPTKVNNSNIISTLDVINDHVKMIDYSLEDMKREQWLMVDEIRTLKNKE
jgi:hypothetical protein